MTRSLSLVWPVLVLLGLSACTSLPRAPESPPPTRLSPLPWLQQWSGEYHSPSRWQDGPETSLGAMANTRLSFAFVEHDDGLVLQLTQHSPSEPARRFLWQFETQPDQHNRHAGRFITLGPEGQARGSCPVHMRVLAAGLVAETLPEQCRFVTDIGEVGLLKELAFDGQRVVIADQLVDLASGEDIGEARVLEAWRMVRLIGWAGRADSGENQGEWRIARPIVVDTGATEIEPLDAAGMGLGFSLRVDYYQPRHSNDVLLRLQVQSTSEDGTATLHQAWADQAASDLGISGPDLQVGLSRQR